MINRFWIFCGLVDHIEEHSYYYPSQLKTIVSQIKQLLYSLGYTFWIINDELIISRDVKELKIKDIKYIRQEEARCIMVDNSDHLYLTEDYIVTHNTFCVAYSSTMLKEKTLVITPNEALKQQWISTYHKMFDYRPSELMNIAGSNIMHAIMEDMVDPADVYFVNHQTLRSFMTSTNGYTLHKFFKKLNIGIKIYENTHNRTIRSR